MRMNEAEAWLPWAAEAEQGLLGGLLLDNDAMPRAAGMVDAGSFWHAPHRAIFAAIDRLVRANKPADVITVFESLRDSGQAEESGGLKYLNDLAQSVPSAAAVGRYAEIVADKALRRSLLSAADQAAALVHEADTADEAIDRVQSLFASIKRLKAGRDPRQVRELMAARVDHWNDLAAGTVVPGIPTGLAAMDEALSGGIKPGHVIVLAARPSVGKTSLATQILLNVAGAGHPVLMLSQEMTAPELMDRLAANLGGVPMSHLSTGRFENGDWARITEVTDRASKLPAYIDDQPALTLLDIRAKARQVKREAGGLALLVIDYLQLCSSTGGSERRHHQIEQISRGIKALAKELDVCVLLLSQLNRASEGDEPELYHLKESGAIEEDADTVVLLHPWVKHQNALVVLAKVAKNRGGRRGRIGLELDGATQRWLPSRVSVARGGAPNAE